MILYHAVSLYQLLECIVHKVVRHNNDHVVLLVPDFMQTRLDGRYNLLNNFVDEVVVFGGEKSGVVDAIERKGHQLGEFSSIYVAAAHTWFGIYLCEHKIPFIFMEDGVGAISQPEVLEKVKVEARSPMLKKDLEFGLFNGEGDNITRCVCNMKRQREGYVNEKAEDFDVIEELEKLENKADIIAVFFSCGKIDVSREKKNVVFLTEHLANLMLLEWEEQIYLYQIVLDYYFQNVNLIIKPHPDDLMYYEELISECRVIREKFPSELLPLVFSEKPECLATVTSTGIRTIKDQFQEVITFNYQFSYYEKEFYSLHRYFAAVRIYEKCFRLSKRLVFAGINRVIIDNMKLPYEYDILESSEELAAVPEASYIVCDKLEQMSMQSYDLCRLIEQESKNSIFLFLNSRQDFVFYDYHCKQIWDYVYPVEIRKTKRREYDVYENMKTEIIYLFYKGEISMQTMRYSLENTGVDVTIDDFKGDKLRIKVLEGLLKATEQRLMHYIEEEKEQGKTTKEEEEKETV